MTVLELINRLLPFATPGTPLAQDLCHLAAICILLYYGPQIQQRLRTRVRTQAEEGYYDGAIEIPEQGPEQGNAAGGNHVGDARPTRQPLIPMERNVGAKKAKSLARKDQRRAYNESMRSQGDAQRATDAESAAEREAALVAEKARRRAAAESIESQKARERDVTRLKEERARREEVERREYAISIVKKELDEREKCSLWDVANLVGGDVDDDWVEGVLKASGILSKQGTSTTIITSTGWIVRGAKEDMAQLSEADLHARSAGGVVFDEQGVDVDRILQR